MDYMIFITNIILIVQTIYNTPMFIYAWVYIIKDMGSSSHVLTLWQTNLDTQQCGFIKPTTQNNQVIWIWGGGIESHDMRKKLACWPRGERTLKEIVKG